MIYAYIRVSTDKQTVENQRFEIERFCEQKGMKIDKWVSEPRQPMPDDWGNY